MRLIFILVGILLALIFIGLGFSFLVRFVENKLGPELSLVVLIVIGALVVLYLILDEAKNIKNTRRKKADYLELGKLLFQEWSDDFEIFYRASFGEGNGTSGKIRRFVAEQMRPASKRLAPIGVLEAFAESKGVCQMIDWRGEENEGEIEEFIDSQLKQPITWTKTMALRASKPIEEQRDGKFIIKLFKAVDKDLKEMKRRLLFFETGSDSYKYMVTSNKVYNVVIRKAGGDMKGVGKL